MKLCWLYRIALSWTTDSDARKPRWVARHLRSCSSCRSLEHEQHTVISALTTAAPTQRPELPPFLHARILAALESEPSGPTALQSAFDWVRVALVPTMAICLLAGYGVWKLKPQKVQPPLAASLPGDLQRLLVRPNPNQMLAWTEKLDQPLQSEIQLVVSDAKVALQSLTANFLPQSDF